MRGYSILNAQVSGVNLLNGIPVWFYFDGGIVGEVALVNGTGTAKMAPYDLR